MTRVWSRRRSRGQSLVEMALAMPLFLMLTLGTADGGRAFFYREAVTNAARQALREAVSDNNNGTQPYAGNQACSGVSSGAVSKQAHIPWQSGDPAYLSTIANAAALESSADGTVGGSKISGALLTVTWHCTGGVAVTNSTNGGVTDPGNVASDSIQVQVSYNFNLITPLVANLFGSSHPAIGATVFGRVEY